MPRKQSKTVEIGDMIYWSSGDDLGECSNHRCNEPGFSYNEDGNLFCEECLEQWHEEHELGFNDPNCCDECGGDLTKTGFCWDCDF